MAVGAVLIKESFYKSFVIIFCLFLGPSLSIGGELQKARGQDAALRDTEGNYQLKGVLDAVWLRFDDELMMIDRYHSLMYRSCVVHIYCMNAGVKCTLHVRFMFM